ncbi:MAG: MFS transporter [Betaproteobacteria bacterium]|nr:MFS transporter [Betaproteobacteria bacterium]
MKPSVAESPYAWLRLGVSLALLTIGAAGMYSVVVILPSVQAEFGVGRAQASLPYTLTMLGFGAGGVLMGRLSDRFGVMVPVLIGSVSLGAGYLASGAAPGLWSFALLHGFLIGLLGSSASFGPVVADVSLWFTKRRGLAVAICISGNYLGGTLWPPVVQHFVETAGWRATQMGIGLFCVATMLPLAFVLRRRAPALADTPPGGVRSHAGSPRALGLSPAALQTVLCIAGVACCVAMSMPQVHIVAYCTDLGIPAARGAEMLSLMMGFGIVSRLASGWIADRIGGLRTLLVGSALQAVALAFFLPSDTLGSLYVSSALFGMFQGGIVPSYPLVVREYFPPRQAGVRVGAVLTATLFGMALGGWMSGAIFDLTGSYRAAFVNGMAWNAVNLALIGWLVLRSRSRTPAEPAPAV